MFCYRLAVVVVVVIIIVIVVIFVDDKFGFSFVCSRIAMFYIPRRL